MDGITTQRAEGEKLKVLIHHPQWMSLYALQRLLPAVARCNGYMLDILPVRSSRDALRLLLEHPDDYAVVILGIYRVGDQEFDALEILRALRSTDVHKHVLVLAGEFGRESITLDPRTGTIDELAQLALDERGPAAILTSGNEEPPFDEILPLLVRGTGRYADRIVQDYVDRVTVNS